MKVKPTIGTKYPLIANTDGTFSVLGVPIFKLGTHRKYNYDEQWFNKLKANHQKDARAGHLPVFFVGHNSYGSAEGPAIGFIDNLVLDGSVIKADFIKFTDKAFQIFKKFPYRSIEVFTEEARLSGVALLGSHSPYHKMPALFSEDKAESEVFTVAEKDDEKQTFVLFTEDNKNSIVNDIVTGVTAVFKQFIFTQPQTKNNPKSQPQKEDKTMEFTAEQKQAFQEEYGIGPEEMAAQNSELRKQNFARSLENFTQKLQTQKFAPVIIEKIQDFYQKYGENQQLATDLNDLFAIISEAGEKKSLFYIEQEQTEKGKKPFADLDFTTVDFADNELHKRINAYAKEHNTSYEEAYNAIIALIEEEEETGGVK